ncbi:MAG: DUF3592 domain-containing protein [Lachnospiraceae bacterium]|nr:DUF3592 domain-containing protein [Lachnospiraceae bacterium]
MEYLYFAGLLFLGISGILAILGVYYLAIDKMTSKECTLRVTGVIEKLRYDKIKNEFNCYYPTISMYVNGEYIVKEYKVAFNKSKYRLGDAVFVKVNPTNTNMWIIEGESRYTWLYSTFIAISLVMLVISIFMIIVAKEII